MVNVIIMEPAGKHSVGMRERLRARCNFLCVRTAMLLKVDTTRRQLHRQASSISLPLLSAVAARHPRMRCLLKTVRTFDDVTAGQLVTCQPSLSLAFLALSLFLVSPALSL